MAELNQQDPQQQGQPSSNIEAENAQLRQLVQGWQEAYQRDTQALVNQARQYAQQQQPAPQAPPQDDDRDLWVEHEDGNRRINTRALNERIANTAAQIVNTQMQRIVPIAEDLYTRHREDNVLRARHDQDMPFFRDAEQQVRNALSTLPPQLAASPDAVRAAYNLVMSQDPALQRKQYDLYLQQQEQERKRQEEQEEEEEEAPPPQQPPSQPVPQPVAPQQPVAARTQATTGLTGNSTARPVGRPSRYSKQMTDQEKESAAKMRMSHEDWVNYRDGN